MPRLNWTAPGKRFYEAGVDRGVLYIDALPGVAWTGLTGVNESSSGGEAKPFYLDGYKYLNTSSPEEFQATITAFTYPDEFAQCNGSTQPRAGLFITQQRRKSFSLSYRTMIGNENANDHGYKIHIVYNALAAPSQTNNVTIGNSIEPNDFSWAITTRPTALTGYRPTAHVVIDTRYADASVISTIEDILYGTDAEAARLPSFAEVVDIFDTASLLVITDNGDGTWTATASFDIIRMLDDDVFEITSPTAVYLDADSYTISSS